ncbi:CRP-like cAMP-binding protein [Variovorax boronicumulans]|uniref:Crp/Fnr family transcriptional regulator n=1 Tax=Variovorax boronicumulans TaxID=436515 RepID=UPI0027865921|nr:cyclic nucleotide-binding domain-containing protein [Variovorax boronicumulans]MDQ0037714.1 CRP-like cAMP-binding protein [Variovorax boronicumulans]
MPRTPPSSRLAATEVTPSPSQASDMRLVDDVQQRLLAVAHRRTLARGESLFHKGSSPDALFGVVSGSLRVSVVAPGGREAVIAMLEPGHWFGEVSLLVGRERVYDTFAVDVTEMAVVAAADFHRLIADHPDVHMAFTRLVCLRLRQALAWIDDVILMPLPVRLAHRLLTLDARAAVPGDASGGTTLGVSQEDLSFMLGVSRQSVNRQLKLWEEDGTLRVRYRSIELLSRAQLERHAAALR